MKGRSFNKIFCIGMNKTGTSSIHKAFKQLGLRSIHHGPDGWENLREHLEKAKIIADNIRNYIRIGKPMLTDLELYDVYSDIGPIIHRFELLDRQYPGSKFIYTERDTKSWVESRQKHVMRNVKNIAEGLYESKFTNVNKAQWIETKKQHFQRVSSYFQDRSNDLLIMNITAGEGYEKLCPFLRLPELNEEFPYKNAAGKQT